MQLPRLALVLLALAIPSILGLGAASGQERRPGPPARSPESAAAWLEADGRFNILLTAVRAADIGDALGGPITLLAPTDAAFRRLPQGALEELLRPAMLPRLRAVLTFHVIAGQVSARDALAAQSAQTLEGSRIAVRLEQGRLQVGSATVIENDRTAGDDVIHVLDGVLLPPVTELSPAARCGAILELAVERGAPLFNEGQIAACAAIYEIAVGAVVDLGSEHLPPAATRHLQDALKEARSHRDPRQKAWALRRGMDDAFTAISAAAAQPAPAPSVVVSLSSPGKDAGIAPAKAANMLGEILASNPAGPMLREAIERVCASLGDGSRTALRLRGAARLDDASLTTSMKEIAADLAFEPTVEAEQPPGFPKFTTVGEIEIKRYPSYRMARAGMGRRKEGSGNMAFFRLFNHIKKNEIAMTAPVQKDYADGDGEATMAFLYGSKDLGPTGAAGKVDVVDVAPGTFLSMGIRGSASSDKIEAAREALSAWLGRQDSWEAAGGFRTMGWNSPTVPESRKYSEVQIPIRPLPGAAN